MPSKQIIFTIIVLILLAFVISLAHFRQRRRTPTASSQTTIIDNNNHHQDVASKSSSPTTSDNDDAKLGMNPPPSSTILDQSKKDDGVYKDISEFDPFPPFITSNNNGNEKSLISGSILVDYIQRNLFKDYTKGYFEFDPKTKSFVSQTTEFISSSSSSLTKQDQSRQQQQTAKSNKSSTTSSSIFLTADDGNNDVKKMWEPLTCFEKSTLRCRIMTSVGGPLEEYYPRFNNRTLFQNCCCGCSDKGRWTTPFAPNAFDVLSSSEVSIETLLKRIIWESSSKKQYPSSNSKTGGSRYYHQNHNNNNNKKNTNGGGGVGGTMPSSLDDIMKILSQSGKNHDAQQLLEQLYIILGRNMHSKIVKTEQSKLMLLLGLSRLKKVNVDVLEPTTIDVNNNDDQESIRRYKKAEQEEREGIHNIINTNDNNNLKYKLKKQKAPRVFITGNSYTRALSSSIASIFRGQTRYFERGSHGTVRYVVTNLGDYFWIEDTYATGRKRGQGQSKTRVANNNNQAQNGNVEMKSSKQDTNNVNTINNDEETDINSPRFKKVTRRRNKQRDKGDDDDDQSNKMYQQSRRSAVAQEENNENGDDSSSSSILPPIRLRKKGEVVFFEIVYQFQTGMVTRSMLNKDQHIGGMPKATTAEDYLVESPLLSPDIQAQEFRGPFSAVFMRSFVIHGIGLFHKFYGDQGFEDYCTWQMKTVMKPQQHQQQRNSSSKEEESENVQEEEDFYVALHGSPNIQYLWSDRNPTGLYAKYELQYGKPAFEKERDELPVPRHVFIPKPIHQRGEVFTAVDDLSHTQCIILPHYPEVGRGFRHEIENWNKNDEELKSGRQKKNNNSHSNNIDLALGIRVSKNEKKEHYLQSRANNFFYDPSDCSDVLSRNYWFKFAFGALVSAKSTRRQLMVKN